MNWYKKSQQQYLWEDDPELPYANVKSKKEYWDIKYSKAGNVVSGLNVVGSVDNTSSISAAMENYYIYDGIREVSMSDFGEGGSYSKDTNEKSKKLAEIIRTSGIISPLIVVVDEDGPYILEGAHRFDALYILGVQSFPALLVLDEDEVENELV